MISFLSLDKTDGFFKLPKSDKKTRHELGFLGGMGSRIEVWIWKSAAGFHLTYFIDIEWEEGIQLD